MKLLRSRSARSALAFVLVNFQVTTTWAVGSVTAWGGGQNATPVPDAARVSLSIDHSLALRGNGSVIAWGYNFAGQCDVPANLGSVKGVAAGDYFSVVLKEDGTVAAWGANDYGQCDVPTGLAGVTAISAGHAHCLALLADGTVKAWGSDAFGQSTVPPGLANVTAVCASWNQSLALRTDGTVVAWGLNDSGQSSVPSGLSNVKAIAANLGYTMALKQDGTVAAWGSGLAAAVPSGLSGVTGIAAGETHALALKSDGSIVAWGSDFSGETEVPANIGGASSIAASWNFSVAVTGDLLNILNPRWAVNTFSVLVPSQNGKSYALEYRNSLSPGSWTSLPAVSGTGSPLTLSDNNASVGQRVYRVRVQ